MKKFLLPVLAVFVLLTSCSQALYKDKYNWVKVDRPEVKTKTDTAIVKSIEAVSKSVPEAVFGIYQSLVIEPAKNKSDPETVQRAQPDADAIEMDTIACNPSVPESADTKRQRESETGKKMITKSQNWFREVDWFEVLWEVGGLLVIILLLVYQDNPVVKMITLILEGLLALASIIVIVYVFIWLCRVFGEFFFMMDN